MRISIVAALTIFAATAQAQTQAARPADVDTTYAPSRCGAAPLPSAMDAIDRATVEWMRQSRTPAASILVVQRGHAATERTYGWADLVNCVRATPEMRFGIGSISKQMTALAVLELVQQGKLSLDDPIARWLPESGDRWRGILVRHLLTHTSGIRDFAHDDPVYPQTEVDRKQIVTDSAHIARFAAAPLNFAPGTAWAYSNTGYLLLSILVQRVGGLPFPEWMHAHVFEPLGMHATRFFDSREIIPQLARGYTIDRSGVLRQGSYDSESFSHWGDMGVISTAHDMGLWAAELDSSRLVSRSLHDLMLAPVRLRNGSVFPYGFGVLVDDYRGERVTTHSGTYGTGYSANLLAMPERGLSVVVLTNQHQGDPWTFTGTLLPLVDSTIHQISSMRSERDPAPERTRRLAAFLNGDSLATPTSDAWRHIEWPRIRDFVSELLPIGAEYIACDDVARRKIERSDATTARECYYRLSHGTMSMAISVFYASDGRVVGMFPRP